MCKQISSGSSKNVTQKLFVNKFYVYKYINKSWKQNPTKQQQYRHIYLITNSIQVGRTKQVEHCGRSKNEILSDFLQWNPTYRNTSVGPPARTYYNNSAQTQDTAPSSSCHAISTDFLDSLSLSLSLSPHLPIVHCFLQIFRATSRIGTELRCVGTNWTSCLCSAMWRGPQEYITHKLVPTSPAVPCVSGSSILIVS